MPADESKMPTVEDQERYWTIQLMSASHNMLQTVQASAGKWATALAAFLAAYATVGFLITPDKIAALPVHGAVEVVLLIAYGLAGALGIGAVIMANLAAQGMPKIRHDTITTAQEYRQLARVHEQLVELAGTPAFEVTLGDAHEAAPSFEALRLAVMTVAQKGIKLQRFKGLGEMNAEQLGETTMAPSTRTLAQVTLEDAFAADRVFSMLMGDQVEPRRAFIEDNARAVANLDV